MSLNSKNKLSFRITLLLIILFLLASAFFIIYNKDYFNKSTELYSSLNNNGSNLLVTPPPINKTTSYLLKGNNLTVSLPSSLLFIKLPSNKISEVDNRNVDNPNITLFKSIEDKKKLEDCENLPQGRSCGGQYLVFTVKEISAPSNTPLRTFFDNLIESRKKSGPLCIRVSYQKLGKYDSVICDQENMRTIREIYIEHSSKIYLFTGISYDVDIKDLEALKTLNDVVSEAIFNTTSQSY